MVTYRSVEFSRLHAAEFEFSAGSARARVVPAKFFTQFFTVMNQTVAAFYLRFRRESLTAFAHNLKSAWSCLFFLTWYTS
jgi:hypothetical protein